MNDENNYVIRSTDFSPKLYPIHIFLNLIRGHSSSHTDHALHCDRVPYYQLF